MAAIPATIDIANGMQLAAATPESTVLLITNTDTSPHNVTLAAGDPVLGAGMAVDQVFAIPASSSRYIGPLTSSRCTQKDGSMTLTFVAGHTGTVTALLNPRGI